MNGHGNFKSKEFEQQIACEKCGLPTSDCVCAGDSQNPSLKATPAPSLAIISERYQLLEPLGEGGMGAVFKAKHLAIDKFFALKMLKKDVLSDDSMRQRFELEAKALSKLDHPNLVSVYDYGTSEAGEPYFVMDYLIGLSLSGQLKRSGLIEQKRAARIFMQICDGLAHAHKSDIVHRDLKPSNVMLITQNEVPDFVKVVDFGIAKLFKGTAPGVQLTQTGDLFGSPPYMSPEQCRGERLDYRSDIYSLGCVMYECLSGQAPFAAENALAVIFKHVNEDAPPFISLGLKTKIDARLEKIVMRCLERDPDDRYQSMYEVRMDLRKFLDGETLATNIKLKQDTAPVERKPAHISGVIIGIFIGAVIACGLLVGMKFYVDSHKTPKEDSAGAIQSHPPQSALSAKETASQKADKADRIRSLYEKAHDSFGHNRAAEAQTYLDQIFELDPNMADAVLLQGYVAYKQNRFAAAHDAFMRAAMDTTCSDRPVAWVFTGYSAINLGNNLEAIQDAEHALALHPNRADANGLLAWANKNLGRYSEALKALDTAQKLEPGNQAFKNLRANVLKDSGRLRSTH